MCRGMVDDGSGFTRQPIGRGGRKRLEVRAFYLRLSSSSSPSCSSTAPNELTLVYHPPIGGAALELAGRALPPASPAEVTLVRVRDDADHASSAAAPAYASADRVSAAEGARFEVYAGKELAAEGVFARRSGGEWRVECRRAPHSRSAASVAEVVVLAEGGVLVRARATRSAGCLTRLEGIPEEEASWEACECGACGEDWEVVGDGSDSGDEEWKEREEAVEAETMRWALEMGAWAVCVGVGLLATARRFSRRRAIR
uniref:Uncharacterized protein n=1 Tax=Avena sativa TaxID=4498 RepID=A0ACD5WF24_AVESA